MKIYTCYTIIKDGYGKAQAILGPVNCKIGCLLGEKLAAYYLARGVPENLIWSLAIHTT